MRPMRYVSAASLAAVMSTGLAQFWAPETVLAAQKRPVFLDAAVAGDPDASSDAAVKRSRFVRMNFKNLIEASLAEKKGKADAAVLDLNLFPDKSPRVRIERVEQKKDHTVYFGRLDDDAGELVLVVQGGVVAGSLRGGGMLYQIRPAGKGGVHEIQEVDSALIPPDGEPLVAEDGDANSAAADVVEADPVAAADDGTKIDVLVAYTSTARAAAGSTAAMLALINLGITETNQAYANSGVIQRVRLVRTVEIAYTESSDLGTNLSRLRSNGDGHLDAVHGLRNTHGADLVHLIVNNGGGFCGMAYVMSTVGNAFKTSAFGVTARTCISPNLSFAHEMGHNMGVQHDRYVDTQNVPYPYAHGYVNQAALVGGAPANKRWRTILAYNNECSDNGISCTRIMYFSNPNRFFTGDRMGVLGSAASSSTNGPADAARTLNNTRTTVANFRQTETAPIAPTTISPSGNITDTTPTFRWFPVADATWYRLWVRKGGVDVGTHIIWYTAAQAGCSTGTGVCSVTPVPALTLGAHTFWIQGWNPGGLHGAWSAGRNFNIITAGFNSQFNGSIAPWQVHSGVWSNASSLYFYTAGLDGTGSSASYPASFTALDYRARVWRYGSGSTNPTRLIIRGIPLPLGSTNMWAQGYMFQITRGGQYSVYKNLTTALQGWTNSAAIVQGSAWNEMRVRAIGSSLFFYINNVLVWSGSDSSFTSGRVGVGMYRGAGTTGNGLYVDYATLTVPADMEADAADVISLEQLHANEKGRLNVGADANDVPQN